MDSKTVLSPSQPVTTPFAEDPWPDLTPAKKKAGGKGSVKKTDPQIRLSPEAKDNASKPENASLDEYDVFVTPPTSPEPLQASDDEYAEAAGNPNLNLDSLMGKRLDSDLADFYRQACQLKKQYQDLAEKYQDQGAEGHKTEAKWLFQSCSALQTRYYSFLKRNPDEAAWLRERSESRVFDSPSDEACYRMHQLILEHAVKVPVLLASSFQFLNDISEVRSKQMIGESPVSGPVASALKYTTLCGSIEQQLSLFELLITAAPEDELESCLRTYAQYVGNTCSCFLDLEANGADLEKMLFKARDTLASCGHIHDRVDNYMLERLKESPSETYAYIANSLKFMLHMRHPGYLSRLLYFLNNQTAPANDDSKNRLFDILRKLALKLCPEDESKQIWKPVVGHLIYLMEQGWVKQQPGSESGSVELQKAMDQLKSKTGDLYQKEGLALDQPAKEQSPLKSPLRKRLKGAQASAASRQGYRPYVLETDRALKEKVFSLPVFGEGEKTTQASMNQYMKKMPSLIELSEIEEEAQTLLQQYQQPGCQLDRWQAEVSAFEQKYEDYLRSHPEESQWLNSGSPGVSARNEKRFELFLKKHFQVKKLQFFSRLERYRAHQPLSHWLSDCLDYLRKTEGAPRKLVGPLLEEIRSRQADCLSLITARLQMGGLSYDSNLSPQTWFQEPAEDLTEDVDSHVLRTFVRETSREMESAVKECLDFLKALAEEFPDHGDSRYQNLIRLLKEAIFKSELFENKDLLIKLWPSTDRNITPQDQEELLCLSMILNPEEASETLKLLDGRVPQPLPEYALWHLNQRLRSFLMEDASSSKKVKLEESDARYKKLEAVVSSLCDGWLLAHWFAFVEQCDGVVPDECHLLDAVKWQGLKLPGLKVKIEQEIQRKAEEWQRILDEDSATARKLREPSPKKQSFVASKKPWLEEDDIPEAELPKEPVLSEVDKIFLPIQPLIYTDPEDAIVQLKKISRTNNKKGRKKIQRWQHAVCYCRRKPR